MAGICRKKLIEVALRLPRDEILCTLNKPETFAPAIIEFHEGGTHRTLHLRQPFQREPDFGVTSVNYDFAELLGRAEVPA